MENTKDKILAAINYVEQTGCLYDVDPSLQRDIIFLAKNAAEKLNCCTDCGKHLEGINYPYVCGDCFRKNNDEDTRAQKIWEKLVYNGD